MLYVYMKSLSTSIMTKNKKEEDEAQGSDSCRLHTCTVPHDEAVLHSHQNESDAASGSQWKTKNAETTSVISY